MYFPLAFFACILVISNGQIAKDKCSHMNLLMICSNLQLSEIDFGDEKYENVTSLLFDGNKVEILNKTSFKNFPNVEILILGNNLINSISTDAFRNLTKLKILYLDMNKISDLSLELPDSTIELTLNKNVPVIGGNIFGPNAPNLIKLYLAECNIEDFSKNILNNTPGLEMLDLRRNSLSVLKSNWFSSSKKIRSLILSWNEISTLSIDGDELEQLIYLDLSYNILSSLSANSFSKTPKLKSLNLDGNRFRRLLDGPFLVHGTLSDLSLAFNSIRWLSPETFKELTSLEKLNLSTNVLSDVEGIFNVTIPTLEELRLSDNFIEAINADTFSGLTSLKTLHVDGNEQLELFNTSSVQSKKFSVLNIANTFIACQCSFHYWSLAKWATDSNIVLMSGCWEEVPCEDKPMPTTTRDPSASCSVEPCPLGERCCRNLQCSVNYKCDASVTRTIPVLVFVMFISVLIHSR